MIYPATPLRERQARGVNFTLSGSQTPMMQPRYQIQFTLPYNLD